MKNKNKIIILIIIVLIVICAGVVVIILNNKHQEKIDSCKERCSYGLVQKLWMFSYYQQPASEDIVLPEAVKTRMESNITKFFTTQEECIDYCLLKNR